MRAILGLVAASLVIACSSNDPNEPADPAAGAGPSHQGSTAGDDSGTARSDAATDGGVTFSDGAAPSPSDGAAAPDTATGDPCDPVVCGIFGWNCDGANKEVGCQPLRPGGCLVPVVSHTCASGVTCDPGTGTCGGCDAHDPCSIRTDGEFLGCMPYKAQYCKKQANGCVTTVEESCGISCVGGSRTGCCGGEGQMCCSPPGAPCLGGLSCQNKLCAK